MPHLFRLEDTALWIDKWNALAPELESAFEIGRCQVANACQAPHRFKRSNSQEWIASGIFSHRHSAEEYVLVVPPKEFRVWAFVRQARNFRKLFASVLIVLSAVLEFLLDALAHFDAQVLSHRKIAIVKQYVKV